MHIKSPRRKRFAARRHKKAMRHKRRAYFLEQLEPRLMLAVLDWTGDIPDGTVWSGDDIHRITGDVRVPVGQTLTIEPGAIVKFNSFLTDLVIEGTLAAQGTAGQKITFTSIRDDIGGDTNGDGASIPGKGDWGVVEIRGDAMIAHAVIDYGGSGAGDAGLLVNGGEFTLANSTVRNTAGHGVRIENANPTLEDNTYAENTFAAVSMNVDSNPTISGVTVTNNFINGLRIDGGTSTIDPNWTNPDIVHWIENDIAIPAGKTLTIGAGVVVKFQAFPDDLIIDGTLTANGKAANPVVFTSFRDDTAGGDTDNNGETTGVGGDWGEVLVSATGTATIDHAEFRFGGSGAGDANVHVDGGALAISNSTIRNAAGLGIHVNNANPILTNNTYSNNSGAAINMNVDSNPTITGVAVVGNGINGLQIDGGAATINPNWTNPDIVHWIENDITIPAGKTLTIGAGVVVKFQSFVDDLIIDGALNANGTAANPVIFTSFRDDTAGGNTNNSSGPTTGLGGDWGEVRVSATGAATIDRAEFRFGGSGDGDANVHVDGGALAISNSTIRNAAGLGIHVNNANPILTNNTYSNNSGAAINMNVDSNPVVTGVSMANNGINGLQIDGGTATINPNWTNPDMVHWIENDIAIPAGKTLTIGAGVVVKFQAFPDDLIIDGTLTANGTAAEPIIFTSFRDDTAGGNTNNSTDQTTGFGGDWGEVRASATGTATIVHAEFRFGGSGANDASIAADGGVLMLSRSVVRDTAGHGVRILDGGDATISNNILVNSTGPGITAGSGSTAMIVNNTIDGNFRGVSADGASTTVTLINNLVTFHSRSGIHATSAPTIDASFNDVFNPAANSGNYEGLSDLTGTDGNLSTDPLYVNRTALDFELAEESPAVDAGTSDDAPTTDHVDRGRTDDPAVANTGGGTMPFFDLGALERDRWLSEIDAPIRSGQIVAGDTLRFLGTGLASPPPTKFAWDFGDGLTSNREDPGLISLRNSGEKEITFTVSGRDGLVDPNPATFVISVVANDDPLPDLDVVTIEIPDNLTIGRTTTLTYSVTNIGQAAVNGTWTDAVYLSSDAFLDKSDTRLGERGVTENVGVGASYVGQFDITLTEALLGTGVKSLIVSVDDNWAILERRQLNNEEALATHAAVPLLTDNVETQAAFEDNNVGHFYRFNVESGGNLLVRFDDVDDTGVNELYVRHDALPTRGVFDARYSGPPTSDPSVVVSAPAPGTWFILVFGSLAPEPAEYSITAVSADTVVQSLTPDHHGDGADAVLTITGAGFGTGTTVELVNEGGTPFVASEVSVDSLTQITATFGAGTVPADLYDLRVTRDGASGTLEDALTVVSGGEAVLETNLIIPQSLGYHQLGTIIIEYANTGDVAMPAPLLILQPTQTHSDGTTDAKAFLTMEQYNLTQGFWTSAIPEGFTSTITFLASGQTPGLLQPGETGRVPVYWAGWQLPWDFQYPTFDFDLMALTVDDPTPVDWSALAQSLPVPTGDPTAWEAILDNLQAQLGDSWGAFIAMLNHDAAYLGRLGQRVTDVSQLMAFQAAQANGLSVVAELAGTFDAYQSAPGLPVSFGRGFTNSISGRYELGPLGRGWSWNDGWQNSLSLAPDGTVVISGPGDFRRIFQPDRRGGYFSRTGDVGKLVAGSGGAFTVRETTGQISAFRADGRLDYIQDPNGNRVTVGYTGDLLTSLTHSSGLVLQLAYNASGRIIQVTDSVGRVTDYAYDPSNEHLLTVTDFDGQVTSYTYSLGSGAVTDHALTSVSNPDGSQVFFGYDSRGRLSEMELADDTNRVQFSYGPAGTVAATDAAAGTLTSYFDHRGLIVKVNDALHRDSYYTYDNKFNLIQITDSSGLTSSYEYDIRGDVTRFKDALGSVIQFSYSGPFSTLNSITDSVGNTTQYTYDASGNLLFTTYADGSVEQFAFDPVGDIIETTNRRGQGIDYEYDSTGRVVSKLLADGSQVTYTYDARGNLTSATDANGTMVLTHDTGDRLLQITYPGGYFLTYKYDAVGRRVQMSDQTLYAVNYSYNADGRLAALTDGSGNSIVAYTYDSTGQLSRKVNGNGTSTTYQYDVAGQLQHLINFAPDSSISSRFDYTYDPLGRAMTMTTLDGQWAYTYDAAGQLTHAVFNSNNPGTVPDQNLQYNYDAAGNRTSTIRNGATTQYATNALNQYTSKGTTTFAYDLDGSQISRTDATGTTTYTYDVENRLVGVSAPGETWMYEYDPLGNRVAATYNGQTTRYLVDPIGLGDVVGQFDDAGNVIAHFTHGLGLTSVIDNADTAAYYNFDAIGNTAALTGPGGAVAKRYTYLPFGENQATAESLINPFQYGGQFGVMKESNGLSFMRARFMDAASGRFTQSDPIGLSGGVNLYGYAGNNPVNFSDPSGLTPGWLAQVVGKQALAEAGFLGSAEAARVFQEIRRLSQVVNYSNRYWLTHEFLRNQTKSGAYKLLVEMRRLAHPGFAQWDKWYGVSRGAAAGSGGAIKGFSTGFVGRSILFSPAKLTLGVVGIAITVAQVSYWAGGKINDHLLSEETRDIIGDTLVGIVDDITGFFGGGSSGNAASRDPNQKLGAAGAAAGNFVALNSTLPYRIEYENDPEATAPAQIVTISDFLPPELDWSTFELTEVGFGDVLIAIADNTQHFETVVPITASSGVDINVQIELGIDLVTGEVFANFISLDPQTGLPPDVLTGFLPPEDETGRGQGFFSFIIGHMPSLLTGTEIRNVAEITFDFSETIATNQIDPHDPSQGTDPNKEALVSIDADGPTSSVASLPATTTTAEFTVSWAGDDGAGSGIRFFDIFVSDNGAPFTRLLDDTIGTSMTFTGEVGHTYSFFSVATDNVGHVEVKPAVAEAVTTVQAGPAWQNPREPKDVNEDESISPVDALIIINEINLPRHTVGSTLELRQRTASDEFYYDVNGDGFVSPVDALIVINHINSSLFGSEGEALLGSAGLLAGSMADGEPSPRSLARRRSALDWERSLNPLAVRHEQAVAAVDDELRGEETKRSARSDELLEDLLSAIAMDVANAWDW